MVRPRFELRPIPATLSAALTVLVEAHVRASGGRRSIPLGPPEVSNRAAYAAAWRIVCDTVAIADHELRGRLVVDARGPDGHAMEEILAVCRNVTIARAAYEAACEVRPASTVVLRDGVRLLAQRSPNPTPNR